MKKILSIAVIFLLCGISSVAQNNGGPAKPGDKPLGDHKLPPLEFKLTDKSDDKVLQDLIKTEVPKFKQLAYYDANGTKDTLHYNLYVPKDYDPSKKYPLVLFMGDASTTKKAVTAPLIQGYGALEFVTDRDQKKHPSFVLVPQFYDDFVTNDDFYASPHISTLVRLIGDLEKKYNIDSDRLYTTGQSMGGMASMYLNITYPDFFAASVFVSCQWDTSKMASFAGKKFFYIVAGGDMKAPKGMAALTKVLEQNEASYATSGWNAKLPDDEQEANVRWLLSKGENINFITFTAGSVLPNKPVQGGAVEHMYSFDYAYKLSEVRDWLFRQKKSHRADSLLAILRNPSADGILTNANKGDWHGTTANSIHAIDKAVKKGAGIVTIYLTRDSAGTVIADAHPIVEPHHAIIADPHLHLTLTDILSYAKDKVLIEFANAASYRDEILAAAKATGTEPYVILGDVDNDENLMFIPNVNLDAKDALKHLQTVIKNKPIAVELSFASNDNTNLEKAVKLMKGKARILINTSSDGHAGSYKDMKPHDDASKTYGKLISMGASIFQTEQIKPLQRWLNGEKDPSWERR